MKIELLLVGGNRSVKPNKREPKIGSCPLKLDKGKHKVGFGPIPITRSKREWWVKRKIGSFKVDSMLGIAIETIEMECP